ncbi:D-glycero-D-manno-heptose 1,7-bisphosphate phosphatase [Roseimicrobium gellanilyticum]|uniref:D,D-heptose 1,7-bisphosphate phosphatase n=1 Tax=Roseimicrobium gellanilyticum TaxID=748857 RepID=A0A366HB84_9BACT|nr:D-glycero-D-manno-heptose 1,7-bisphosphate phosphatase [Roseimicrobium gellanilyticum]
MSLRPAFFFDRDGVVNVSPGPGYVLCWEEFHFCEGVIEALAWLKKQGFALVLVTNQQGVGKGLMTLEALDDMHHRMQEELAKYGAAFDAIHACTCLKSDPGCTCHKPSPEMVLAAASNLNLDLTRSWLIGDQDRDIQMAMSAGVPHTIRVVGENSATIAADHEIRELTELLPLLQKIVVR